MGNNGVEIFKNVPFLTKENFESVLPYNSEGANERYFEDLQQCASVLKEKYNGRVNGLWFIRVPAVDGGVQTIVRTTEKFEAVERNTLAADVFDFCCDELGYIIQNDSTDGLRSVPIDEWVEEGQVFAVFDLERT